MTRTGVHPTRPGYTVFAYIIEGKAYFCKEKNPFSYEVVGASYFDLQREPFVTNENLVLFDDGGEVFVSTGDQPARFLLISGRPIGQPVAWFGPIVMNTQQELQIAFNEYHSGSFIKHKNP